MYFNALLQLKLFFHAGEFGFIILLNFCQLIIVTLQHVGLLPFVILLSYFCLLDVLLFFVEQVLLEVLFFLFHVLHTVLIVLVLLKLCLLTILLNTDVRFLLFILQ